jgi:6,7-dimethyl-8-ribityllumazine synthase
MTDVGAKLAIVAAEFNRPLTDAMLEAALAEAKAGGATVTLTVRVPGCYEVPLLARRLITRPDVHALVVLGFIERGETLHGEVMGHVVHQALLDLSLAHDKPVGLGIIGPGATPEQADLRKDAYARAAVRAALAAIRALGTTTPN